MISRTLVYLIVLGVCASAQGGDLAHTAKPFVIKLDIPAPKDTAGGIIVTDVDNDGKMDYLVTVPGHLGVYGNDGKKLWIKQTDIRISVKSEKNGLPGHHGPGVGGGDVDGDGKCEVVFLTNDSVLHIVDGATGREKATIKPPIPEGAARWEVASPPEAPAGEPFRRASPPVQVSPVAASSPPV